MVEVWEWEMSLRMPSLPLNSLSQLMSEYLTIKKMMKYQITIYRIEWRINIDDKIRENMHIYAIKHDHPLCFFEYFSCEVFQWVLLFLVKKLKKKKERKEEYIILSDEYKLIKKIKTQH